MCKHEIVGDYYRGCGHFHPRYFTGETRDCDSEACKTSCKHPHEDGSPRCQCAPVIEEERRIQNLFQINHPHCPRTAR